MEALAAYHGIIKKKKTRSPDVFGNHQSKPHEVYTTNSIATILGHGDIAKLTTSDKKDKTRACNCAMR